MKRPQLVIALDIDETVVFTNLSCDHNECVMNLLFLRGLKTFLQEQVKYFDIEIEFVTGRDPQKELSDFLKTETVARSACQEIQFDQFLIKKLPPIFHVKPVIGSKYECLIKQHNGKKDAVILFDDQFDYWTLNHAPHFALGLMDKKTGMPTPNFIALSHWLDILCAEKIAGAIPEKPVRPHTAPASTRLLGLFKTPVVTYGSTNTGITETKAPDKANIKKFDCFCTPL